MIYVEMYGRLGNQFFRYAMARLLQEKYYPNEDICISFNQINGIREETNDDSWKNYLSDFNVNKFIVYDKAGKVIFNESSIKQKFIAMGYYLNLKKTGYENLSKQELLEIKYEKKLNISGLYWFRSGFHQIEYSSYLNKFVSGNFENKSYFNEIRNKLINEFTPKYPPRKENSKLYEIINKENSVCVSIRRGDFVSNDKIRKTHYVCDEEYFKRAIKVIKENVKNPCFILFSDDINWARKHISISNAKIYFESGNDPIWEKLRLMYSCKHFILSNSSFSWWAQYLSRNKNKIVVCPSRWYNNNYNSGLIEKDFIKIDVGEIYDT